jgi:hypothetical protein
MNANNEQGDRKMSRSEKSTGWLAVTKRRQKMPQKTTTDNSTVQCEALTTRGTRCKNGAVTYKQTSGRVLAVCTIHHKQSYLTPYFDCFGMSQADES